MKILLVTYYFPPDSSSGSFRPLAFTRHLQAMGQDVFVLTSREQDYLPEQPKDPNLLKELDEKIFIYRSRVRRPMEAIIRLRDSLFRKTDAESVQQMSQTTLSNNQVISSWSQFIKDFFTDLLTTPDKHIWWLPSAVNTGRRVIKDKAIDVIYTTGGPWTTLLIGALLKKLTHKPLIMDFRDPWIANPYFLVRNRFLRWLDHVMERTIITIADHIITNTEELREDFLIRYPKLKTSHVTAIPNGFEEYFARESSVEKRKFTLTHTGALYFSRNPRNLLQAIVKFLEKHQLLKNDLRLVLLGELDMEDPELGILLQHPLLEGVIELLPRVPYHETIQYQNESDVLFLIQPDFPLQVPRKLYEYMAFRKPILGITNRQGATARIILENQLGMVVENQVSEIEAALNTLYEKWKQGTLKAPDLQICEKFMNKNLTRRLLNILNTLVVER